MGKTKMPPGIKSQVYLGDIMIYSKDPTGLSLTYMEDMIPYYVRKEGGSRLYPKVWEDLTKLNPNLCSLDEWKKVRGNLATRPSKCHNNMHTFPKE